MKLRDALTGGTAGGYGVGVTLAFGVVAVGVVALPLTGAYFGAMWLGSTASVVGALKGALGLAGGFIGGGMVAGTLATPVFYGVMAATTAVGAAIGGVIGVANEIGKAIVAPFKRDNTVQQNANKKIPEQKAAKSKIAEKTVKPGFEKAQKAKAPKADKKKSAPKPKNTPKA